MKEIDENSGMRMIVKYGVEQAGVE